MPKNPKTVPVNWTFKIECVDCKATWTVDSADPSIERLPNGGRLVMLMIPNECPECHNLHVVKAKEPS